MAEGDYTGKGIDESHSAKQDMTPDFLKSNETNPSKPSVNSQTTPGREGAAARAGEDEVASDKPGQKQAEYENKVKGKKEAMKAMAGGTAGMAKFMAKNGIRGTFKKGGATIGIIMVLMVGFMGSSFIGQGAMLDGLVKRIGVFDPVDAANSVRSRAIFKSIMRGQNAEGGRWSKLSDKIKRKLGIAGIEVEETADGKTNFKTETESGEIKTVTADTLDNAIDTDNKFLTQYTDGTASVGNSVHSNYGEEAEVLYDNVRVTRGDLNDIKADDEYEPAKAAFDEKVEADVDKVAGRVEADFDSDNKKTKEVETEDGKKTVETDDVETKQGKLTVDQDTDPGKLEADIDAEIEGSAALKDGAGKGSKFANGLCQAYNIISGISRSIKALELAQAIVVAFKILQAIQRMQAGDGGADVLVDVVGTYLVTEKTTTFNFGSYADPVTLTGSAMSSTPIASLFGGARLTQGDPIVRNFLVTDNDFQNFFRDFGNNAGGYRACIGVQYAAAIVDLAMDAASVFTFGLSKLGQLCVSVGKGMLFSAAVAVAVTLLVPLATKAYTRDFGDLLSGPESSGAFVWGAGWVQERLGQMFHFRPATDETWTRHAVERNKLLAERARYDRATKSPFDTSSEYTFMGTILSKLNTMSLQTNTIFGKAGNILSVVGKSFVALTPASSADSAVDTMVSEGACALNDINSTNGGDKMYCDAFETAWNVPDYTSMGTRPEEVMWYWQNHTNRIMPSKGGTVGSFTSDYDPVSNPNPAVKQHTDLWIHITQYANRGSELNVADSEIEAYYANGTTGSSIADAIIGAIPIVGSLIDIYNSEEKREHVNQILGSDFTDYMTPEIRVENNMAERYIHDQDMGVAFGAYEASQSAAAMKEYRKEHPIDHSLNGIVAHLSGLSKEEVAESFQYIESYSFVAQYEPSGLGPVVISEPESERVYIEEDGIGGDLYAVLHQANYYYRKDQYITA